MGREYERCGCGEHRAESECFGTAERYTAANSGCGRVETPVAEEHSCGCRCRREGFLCCLNRLLGGENHTRRGNCSCLFGNNRSRCGTCGCHHHRDNGCGCNER